MLLEVFFILLAFAAALIAWGASANKNFGIIALGLVLFIIIGVYLNASGLQIDNITSITRTTDESGNTQYVPAYTLLTSSNDSGIWALSMILTYLPIPMILAAFTISRKK